jgi:NADH:ubiquinone oxidoreductase subunit E
MSPSQATQLSQASSQDVAIDALDRIIDELADTDGALVPVLQRAQDLYGYLPRPALEHIALRLGKPLSEVTGVVTFYSYFSLVPRGKNLVRVCLGTACYVRGGKDVLKSMQDALHIEVGQTTADRQFSLEIGRCFGACGLAPAVMVNDQVHQRVKPARIRELLASSAGSTGGDHADEEHPTGPAAGDRKEVRG